MFELASVALLAAGAGTAVATWWTRRGWLTRRRTERLIVHTTDAQTIAGTVRAVSADGLLLAAARLVDVELDLAGDVWIPKAKILMVQHQRDGA